MLTHITLFSILFTVVGIIMHYCSKKIEFDDNYDLAMYWLFIILISLFSLIIPMSSDLNDDFVERSVILCLKPYIENCRYSISCNNTVDKDKGVVIIHRRNYKEEITWKITEEGLVITSSKKENTYKPKIKTWIKDIDVEDHTDVE